MQAGGIIGRLVGAQLQLDHPQVSEAHALVSLRNRCLRLLALRRWFEVNGKRSADALLMAGQRVRLAPDVLLDVLEVVVDAPALALVWDGGLVELSQSVYTLDSGNPAALATGAAEPTEGAIWSTGTGYRARVDGGVLDLIPGTELRHRGQRFLVKELASLHAGSTTGDAAGLDPAIRIVLRHDTVHLFRSGRPPATLSGILARIVSEVGAMGAPAPWDVPAKQIWRRGSARIRRQNWDRNMRRLRAKLREANVRQDLVRADGRGNVELYLLPGDELVDEM